MVRRAVVSGADHQKERLPALWKRRRRI